MRIRIQGLETVRSCCVAEVLGRTERAPNVALVINELNKEIRKDFGWILKRVYFYCKSGLREYSSKVSYSDY